MAMPIQRITFPSPPCSHRLMKLNGMDVLRTASRLSVGTRQMLQRQYWVRIGLSACAGACACIYVKAVEVMWAAHLISVAVPTSNREPSGENSTDWTTQSLAIQERFREMERVADCAMGARVWPS